MRLLLISSEFPPGPGGIGTHAYQVAHHLRGLGWDISVLTPQDYVSEEEIERFNESQDFPVVRFRPVSTSGAKTLYRWRVASQWIKTWRPDIILASGDRAIYLSAGLALRHRLPWVAVEHGRVPGGGELGLKRWAFGRADAAVCVSNYTRQRMLGMNIKPRAGQVIPNGADANKFQVLPRGEVQNFRDGLKLNASHILLTVGNVTDRKGQDVVISALPYILKEVPAAHYLAVGLPTKQEEFMRLARQLGVAGHVHFLGKVDDYALVRLLNGCDVFVMTSRHTSDQFEGYGIAVVEAALCGKPAVVSANSGLAEAIIDGKTGFCVPEGDAMATAEAVTPLLTNEALRQQVGEAARKRALEEQRWEDRAKAYDTLLRSLLRPRAATSHGTGELRSRFE